MMNIDIENNNTGKGGDPVANDHHSLPAPEELHGNKQTTAVMSCRSKIIASIIATVGLAVIVTLSVSLSQYESTSSESAAVAPRKKPPTRINKAVDMLSSVTPRKVLEDATSPQYKAAVWLAHHDKRHVDIPTSSDVGSSTSRHFIQRYALAVMYYAMNGKNWRFDLDFLTDRHECDWNQHLMFHGRGLDLGVSCDDDFRITKIMNFGNRLTGSVPKEIGLLTNLVEIDLFDNGITGSLPSEMSNLTKLDFLVVQRNSLAGPVPEWLGNMSSLEILSMGNNMLTGTLPHSMSRMKLKEIYLDDNSLTGDVRVLTKIPTLERMYLENNRFSGELNATFRDIATSGNLQSLKEMDLSGNKINGTLPRALLNLRILDLHDNKLSGSLPSPAHAAGETYPIEFLALHKNQLSGEIPETVHRMPKLTHLDLSSNRFAGDMPDFGRSMSQLSYLFLSKNKFATGPIPSSMRELVNLRELSLKGTNRHGDIPHFVGDDLKDLVMLDLGENDLTSAIPKSLGGLSKLSFLILNDNKLSGSVPSTFDQLSKLVLLVLDDNDLTGSAAPVCGSKPKSLEIFIADCHSEVTCPCCTECCKDGDASCNDRPWLSNYEPTWETGYSRHGKQFVFSDEVKLVAEN